MASCETDKAKDTSGDLIAKVGDHSLYSNELPEISIELNTTDSAALHNGFVEQWVRKYVLVNEAESNLSNSMDINSLVDDYRSSLLIDNYRQSYIFNNLDTTVSNSQLEEEYGQHGESFGLAANLYQIIWAKIDAKQTGLESFYRNWRRGSESKISTYCKEKAFSCMLESKWLTIEEVYNFLPEQKFASSRLKKGRELQQHFKGFEYFVKVNDIKYKGDSPPLAYLESKLRELIIHKRKKTLLNKLEADLYKRAIAAQKIKVYRK